MSIRHEATSIPLHPMKLRGQRELRASCSYVVGLLIKTFSIVLPGINCSTIVKYLQCTVRAAELIEYVAWTRQNNEQ